MIPHKINKKSPFETQLAFRTVSFLLQISHLAFIVNYNMDIVEKYKKIDNIGSKVLKRNVRHASTNTYQKFIGKS